MSDPESEPDLFGYETSLFLRIPRDRIGAVIGVKGRHRKAIEEATETNIIIDSDTGEVEVRPSDDLKDPVQLFNARDIVKAIGRGFHPDQALKLASDDYYLEIIRLKPLVGSKGNQLHRVRGRLIGSKGRTRKTIEELVGVNMVVSGSTVSLIGKFEPLSEAKDAVMDIIHGQTIEAVLGRLEARRQELAREEEKLWQEEKDIVIDDLYPVEEKEEDIFEDFEED